MTLRVFFDMKTADGGHLGRIIMKLRPDDVISKTSENFRALCTGEKGFGFKGCVLHQVVPGSMFDFTAGNVTGLKEENFNLKHNSPGILRGGCARPRPLRFLGMANAGSNANGLHFFLCNAEPKWLDDRHVVFGEVVEGKWVLDTIESYGSESGKTSEKIVIADCGQLLPAD